MNWKKQEKELIKQLEEMGLKREVIHDIYDGNVEKEAVIQNKGMTEVFLFPNALWQEKKKMKDDSIEGHIAYGNSECSVNEHYFSKRIGRVIATGRAIKNYKNTLITG